MMQCVVNKSVAVALLLLALMPIKAEAQFNEDLDANWGNEEKMLQRDDQIWSEESANTVYTKAGNICLTSETRIGLSDQWEISSNLGADIFAPNFFLKKLFKISNKQEYWAFKVGLITGAPGYHIAQNHKYGKIISPDDDVPFVIDTNGELIYSYAFRHDPNCAKDNVWLVLTNSIAGHIGMNVNGKHVSQAGYHILANRAETLRDWSTYLRAKVWVDWMINSWIVLRGGMKYYFGNFKNHHALETQVQGEFFLFRSLGIKLGGLLSYAHYTTVDKKFALFPSADLTYYFGKKTDRDNKLFDTKMRNKMKSLRTVK